MTRIPFDPSSMRHCLILTLAVSQKCYLQINGQTAPILPFRRLEDIGLKLGRSYRQYKNPKSLKLKPTSEQKSENLTNYLFLQRHYKK